MTTRVHSIILAMAAAAVAGCTYTPPELSVLPRHGDGDAGDPASSTGDPYNGDPSTGDPYDGDPTSKAECCKDWCQSDDRFGGATYQTEAWTASNSVTGCTMTTGCTCAASAAIASTWTVITGEVCDAHDFATTCPGDCNGDCPVITIESQWDRVANTCICIGSSGPLTQTIWSSECEENDDYSTTFVEDCP